MIEAYAIGVAAKLEDGVSPGMLRIIELTEKASGSLIAFSEALRSLSNSGIGISRNLEKASLAAGKIDSPGLAAAAARLDEMASATADIAKNLEAARAAGASVNARGVIPPAQSGGGSGASGNRESSVASHVGSNAALAAGGTMAYGIYENAKLQDLNMMAVVNMQRDQSEWAVEAEKLRKREFSFAHRFAGATHGEIRPFAEAEVVASRLLRTMPEMKQDEVMQAVMPYAALEAKQKGVPLPESIETFIGLAHQAGAYSLDKMKPLFEGMVQASLTTDMSLPAIAKQASYAIPSLRSAGADPTQILTLLATMNQAGITSTKAATWVNAMASNALPNTLGSGLFSNKKQNEALHKLRLYQGNQAQFFTNGKMDVLKETQILAEDRLKMQPLEFNALLRMAFATQGQRAGALFSEDSTQQNMAALIELTKKAQDPTLIANMMRDANTVSKADQTIANANMTLMNASATFTGPVNWMLDKASGIFDKTESFTDLHPALGAAGIGAGIFGTVATGMVAGKLMGKGADKVVEVITKNLSKATGSIFEGVAGAIETAGGGWFVMSAATKLLLAGAIGYAIGTYVVNPAIDWAVEHLPGGGKDDTLGTYYYNLTHDEPTHDIKFPAKLPSMAPLKTDYRQDAAADRANTQRMIDKAINGNQPPINLNAKLYIDGKELSSYLIPDVVRGPAGFNSTANLPTPGMGSLGFGN